MSQIGFYFNMDACVGCRTCQIACKDKSDLDLGPLFRIVDAYSVGTYPSVKAYYYSGSCNHCEVPACYGVCPTGAISKEDDGTVLIDVNECNSCGACIESCPYDAPKVVNAEGVVDKCDACVKLRAEGDNPSCVDSCPLRALDFGDIDELKQKYGEGLVNVIAPLPNPATGPALLINAKPVASESNYQWLLL